jgi:oxygen-independent coproporphyrinogen III oxidase
MSKQIDSLYIHVPFCKHLCNYCDFYKRKLTSDYNFDHYEALLANSWQVHQNFLNQNGFEIGPLETLYFGGGTPSLWGERGIDYLAQNFIGSKIKFDSNYEFSMEIDPAAVNEKEINLWQDLGVNRFSVGLQSWDEEYLKIMDRIHTKEQAVKTLGTLSDQKLNFTVDFMLGFPAPIKRKRDIIKELEEILSFNPSHISLYILSVGKDYPFYKLLPEDDLVSIEYQLVSSFLREKGFSHYEVSNYAKPGFESNHNKKYWKQESVAALGPSGTGLLKFTDDKAIRYKWTPMKPEFNQELLDEAELKLEKLYTCLRTSDGISINEMIKPSKLNQFNALACKWCDDSLARLNNDKLVLTPSGYVVLDNLVDQLFQIDAV